MISIQVLCHVDDLMHGFVTSWENVLFTLENIGTCVKITWNYFPCLILHKVKVFIDYAQGLVQLLGTSGHVTLSVDMIGKHSISCFNEEILCIKNWNHFKNCMYHKLNNLRL